ncbi:MAG: hypothetical protein QGG71_27745 [Pirellulaceae bacterium]|jgi:hypothetical protein|nr:hypothetical protein [Pirellulaceae bacterium]
MMSCRQFIVGAYGVGFQNDMVLSDAQGRFKTYVLLGAVRTRVIILPAGYKRLDRRFLKHPKAP